MRDYRLLCTALVGMGLAGQMVDVAIGWQVYAIHRSALDLGLIGLAEFLPLPLLALPAGQLADRLPRRLVFAGSLLGSVAIAVCLVAVTLSGASQLWPFFALAAANGVFGALGTPAARALPPALVPPEILASALALRSVVMRSAMIVGPALGGFVFALRPELVYVLAAALFGAALLGVAAMRPRAVEQAEATPRLEHVLAGIAFIRRSRIVLGAITLDLFAVLFGGAVALLPLFAREILHTGPLGLGILRSAPSVGGLIAAAMLTRSPLGGRAGQKLLLVVAAFGTSIVVFGLSHSFLLSFVALAVSGFADMFSVNIRATAVALATPDALLGRVLAVEMVFISASNELGAFESGLAASLLGAVTAVVLGGLVTIGLAAGWAPLFPALARIDRLEELRPAET